MLGVSTKDETLSNLKFFYRLQTLQDKVVIE